MVSTRGPKSRYFEKGEKVLCYEPDPSKAKVLYDSKILGTYESKDRRGRKSIQYKIHFQGWSSSWDRKVSADFVLKDTEENRQLQRDLAEKAQLLLGAYLYRKEHSNKNKKRSRKSTTTTINSEDSADASTSPTKFRPRGLSEDNISSSGSTLEKNENCSLKDDCETDSCCSSVESFHDEDRVLFRISERLRQYLEYDQDMIVKYGKQHALPSRIPIVAILENFVKQTALKLVFSNNPVEGGGGGGRRRTTQQRMDKKEKDVDKITTTVGLLKEVADGLRIYFDFTISEYLLYKEEEEYALSYLSEENLKNFTYIATPAFSMEWFNAKSETPETTNATSTGNSSTTPDNIAETTSPTAAGGVNIANSLNIESTNISTNPSTISSNQEEQPQRRKLRSHRSDDCDLTLENCLSSIASTSSGASTPLHSSIPVSHLNYLKTLPPISPLIRDFVQNVLSWRLLPSNAMPAPAMIFGAPHLARLIVKLPEFLNASSMTDEKLKLLLQHLDTFTNYLESHKEWFNEDNYSRGNVSKKSANIITTDTDRLDDNAQIYNNVDAQQQESSIHQQEQKEISTDVTMTTTTTPIATVVESVAA